MTEPLRRELQSGTGEIQDLPKMCLLWGGGGSVIYVAWPRQRILWLARLNFLSYPPLTPLCCGFPHIFSEQGKLPDKENILFLFLPFSSGSEMEGRISGEGESNGGGGGKRG